MNRILINFAHPARRRSRINKALIDGLQGVSGVTINDLYAHYPDFIIDIKREQELCSAHEIIIFQHPFYWYSYPSIVKEWQDLVLQHGWAYGPEAEGLRGKYVLQAITAGADEKSYDKRGGDNLSIRELTSSFKAMAKLCNMNWLPPFVVLGIHRGLAKEKVESYAGSYRDLITALRDDKIDFARAVKKDYLNSATAKAGGSR